MSKSNSDDSIETRSSDALVRATPSWWDTDKHYAVTVTFKPTLEIDIYKVTQRSVLGNRIVETRTVKRKLIKQSPYNQFEMTKNILAKVLDKNCMEYWLHAEYHKNGTIHYHGVIGHKHVNGSLIRASIQNILRKYGRCTVDDLSKPDGWYHYCTKDPSCADLIFHNVSPQV